MKARIWSEQRWLDLHHTRSERVWRYRAQRPRGGMATGSTLTWREATAWVGKYLREES